MGIGSRISKLASQGAGGLASRGLTSIGDGRVLPGRSVVLGDPTPVDPGCFAAFPNVLAARKTEGIHGEVNRAGSRPRW